MAIKQISEIACSALSNGHVADIKMVEQLVAGIEAKLYGDRGYISQELKIRLKDQGIDLITYHRKNMRAIQLCAFKRLFSAHKCALAKSTTWI